MGEEDIEMNRKIVLVLFIVLLLTVGAIAQAQSGSGAAYGGPGLHQSTLYAGQTIDAGVASIWNSPKKLMIQIEPSGDWQITAAHIYVGYPELDELPVRRGNPVLGKFPYKKEYDNPVPKHTLTLDLKEDLDFSWGSNYKDFRKPTIAVHADLVQLNDKGNVIAEEGAWAFGPFEFDGAQWGWYFDYELAHPMRGQFIDSPVIGLFYRGPTQEGFTADEAGGGGFLFFPGEEIEFSVGTVVLGKAEAVKKTSPLDLFPSSDTTDPSVINVARLLQSLDDDHGDGKINIQPVVVGCLDMAKEVNGLSEVDFANSQQVEDLIAETIVQCEGNPEDILLRSVDADEAQGNLEAGLNASGIFRKNMTKTEDWGETKQKLDVMPVYFPGLRSNNDPSLCIGR
jgi:hypothetical protein